MTKYSREQIEGFARTAGLNAEDARVASYIAMAESSGNPNATNHYTEKGQTYYVDGLWQISTIHNLGSRESMRDPMTNARAMAKLHGDSGWTPWASSKHIWGSAVSVKGGFIGEGNTGDAKVDIPIVSDAIDAAQNVTNGVTAGVTAVVKAGNWIANPHNMLRIAYTVLGGAVILVGLTKLVGYDAGLIPTAALAKMSKGTATAPIAKDA